MNLRYIEHKQKKGGDFERCEDSMSRNRFICRSRNGSKSRSSANSLREEEQIPSTTQLVNFYKINHLTVSKGIHLLVEDGLVYKKRGVGMFVAKGAREKAAESPQRVIRHTICRADDAGSGASWDDGR